MPDSVPVPAPVHVKECEGWSEAEYEMALLKMDHPDRRYTVIGTDLGWGVFQLPTLCKHCRLEVYETEFNYWRHTVSRMKQCSVAEPEDAPRSFASEDNALLSRAVGVLLRRAREDLAGGDPLTGEERDLLAGLAEWWHRDGYFKAQQRSAP